MSIRLDIVSRFASSDQFDRSPLLLLDLTLWCKWHAERGTLPTGWGPSVIEAARALGTAAWAPFKPWRVEYEGVRSNHGRDGAPAQR